VPPGPPVIGSVLSQVAADTETRAKEDIKTLNSLYVILRAEELVNDAKDNASKASEDLKSLTLTISTALDAFRPSLREDLREILKDFNGSLVTSEYPRIHDRLIELTKGKEDLNGGNINNIPDALECLILISQFDTKKDFFKSIKDEISSAQNTLKTLNIGGSLYESIKQRLVELYRLQPKQQQATNLVRKKGTGSAKVLPFNRITALLKTTKLQALQPNHIALIRQKEFLKKYFCVTGDVCDQVIDELINDLQNKEPELRNSILKELNAVFNNNKKIEEFLDKKGDVYTQISIMTAKGEYMKELEHLQTSVESFGQIENLKAELLRKNAGIDKQSVIENLSEFLRKGEGDEEPIAGSKPESQTGSKPESKPGEPGEPIPTGVAGAQPGEQGEPTGVAGAQPGATGAPLATLVQSVAAGAPLVAQQAVAQQRNESNNGNMSNNGIVANTGARSNAGNTDETCSNKCTPLSCFGDLTKYFEVTFNENIVEKATKEILNFTKRMHVHQVTMLNEFEARSKGFSAQNLGIIKDTTPKTNGPGPGPGPASTEAENNNDDETKAFDINKEYAFKKMYVDLTRAGRKIMSRYAQFHFDFVSRNLSRKMKYIETNRVLDQFNQQLQQTSTKQLLEAYDKAHAELVDLSSKFVSNMYAPKIKHTLDSLPIEIVSDQDERNELIERSALLYEDISNINDKISSFYSNNITLMDIIFDSQFMVLYVIKLLSYLFLVLSFYLAEKLFSEMYMKAVYAESKDPPNILNFLAITLIIHAGFNLFMIVVLLLLMFLFKTSSNMFVINGYLLKSFLIDYIASIALVSLLAVIIGLIIQKKRYFRYKTEGLRGIRALREILTYLAIVIFLIPFFYFLL
jgi:ABC-type multidrug transport system permease subunit